MVGLVTSKKGVATHANYTVESSGAMKITSASPNRKSITFQNQGSVTVFLAKSDVATTGAGRGYALFTGATFTDNASSGEWWAIAASSTAIVHVIEVL